MGSIINGQAPSQASDFWVRVMETLNASGDIYQPVPGLLRETCEYFGFGCGFIYKSDYTQTYFLQEHHLLYDHDHLREQLNLRDELGGELFQELTDMNAVIFPTGNAMGQLEEKLAELFNAKSMVLIPILDASKALIAFTGLVDRRGRQQSQPNVQGAYAVMCALANHVKLQLYQQRADNTEKAMRSAMDHMGIDIYINDFDTHEILYANESMSRPYGGIENLLGHPCWEVLYQDKHEPCDFCPQKMIVDEEGNPSKVYSWDYQRPMDGAWFRVFSAAFNWEDGRLAHVVSSVEITESKRNELIIRQMADYDALSGLPNRRKLLMDLEAQTKGARGYLLFFDLDGFKQVNDTFGHRAGDELLERLGNILQNNSLTEGKSYRHGGDEFVVVCHGASPETLQRTLGALMANFNHSWALNDGEVICKCSIGVASYPDDGETPEDLLHHADLAMYAAKEAGKGLIRFWNGGKLSSPGEYFSFSESTLPAEK